MLGVGRFLVGVGALKRRLCGLARLRECLRLFLHIILIVHVGGGVNMGCVAY